MTEMSKHHNMSKAFISYSHKDRVFIDKLVTDLVKAGVEIWIDRWEIKVGDSLIEKIESGIKENDYLIVALSQNAVSSNWVKKELNSALVRQLNEKSITILPILIEKCDVPLLISEVKFANFSEDYNEGLLDLFKVLTNLPPSHFTQGFADVYVNYADSIRENNTAGDLILEGCQSKDIERKFLLFEKAENVLTRILSREPRFGQAIQNLGTIMYERGLALNKIELIHASINIFKEALQFLSHFSQTSICNYSIGRSYARIGNFCDTDVQKNKFYSEALTYLTKAIEEDRKLHFAYIWLARVYQEKYKISSNHNDYQKAKENYIEAIQLNPGYLDSLDEMKELNERYGKSFFY